ncbi:hypothetical protein S7711_10584 [Stachybotrys chartarum IBT 7711]|uniref:Uncharacterized protein n=1 Tax=Stachybotrys chartarum (strain CBS 109288 / IBT 7711) TaxID=1280523 RepID=A0A084B5D6_STACB|nr:hypothetical protein S7711_10584 [Stachybotrys chartarum IBT 7711]
MEQYSWPPTLLLSRNRAPQWSLPRAPGTYITPQILQQTTRTNVGLTQAGLCFSLGPYEKRTVSLQYGSTGEHTSDESKLPNQEEPERAETHGDDILRLEPMSVRRPRLCRYNNAKNKKPQETSPPGHRIPRPGGPDVPPVRLPEPKP